MIRHRLPRRIPGHGGKQGVGGLLTRNRVFDERRIDRFSEFLWCVRDPAQLQVAVRMHDVGN